MHELATGGAPPPTTRAGGAYFRAVAVDFDGTLAADGAVSAGVLGAVDASRASGVGVVLVTGRILAELAAVFPELEDHVDAVVAENGAVLAVGGARRLLAAPVEAHLAEALTASGIPFRRGQVLLACAAADEGAVLEEVRRLGLDCQLVRNRSELMVLPAGVTKGSGLVQALGVAVANAVPSIREHADVVLDQPDGAGVAGLLAGGLLSGRELVHPRRWRIELGTDTAGQPVWLPASQLNLLIAGGTGAGKSRVAGLLAEQLIRLGYALLVIDPEGDHVGLGRLYGVLVVGADGWLPPPEQLVRLVHHPDTTAVADLSTLDPDDQAAYLRGLPVEVTAHRAATGLPQWVVIDEAHGSIGRHGAARALFDPASKGHCLVTWLPQDLPGAALAGIDAVIALGAPEPAAPLVDLVAAVADLPRAAVAGLLQSAPAGTAVLADRTRPRRVVVFTPAPRLTPHERHAHKYGRVPVDPARRFYFRGHGDIPTGVSAGNLPELRTVLARCERDVLRHHCPNGDLSRWIREVFHDPHLAEQVAAIEHTIQPATPAALVEAARLDLLARLQQHAAG